MRGRGEASALDRWCYSGRASRGPNLIQAASLGLLRSAHSEHPERFSLIDLDDSELSLPSLQSALILEEPEFALRAGTLYTPRLARPDASADGVLERDR